jgi:hypothetical protein
MKRKNGAAGQNTKLVATIPPVIAPVCPPPLVSFTALERRFLAIGKLDVINFYVELPASRHALLVLGISDSADGKVALGYDNYVIDLHFLQYFEVDVVSSLRIRRTEISIQPQLDGSAIVKDEFVGGCGCRGLLRGGLLSL